MKLALNASTTVYGNLMNDIRVAKSAGFEGLELQNPKIYRFMDSGLPVSMITDAMEHLQMVGIGAFLNMERAGQSDAAFEKDFGRMIETAAALGAPMIELCTGPIDDAVVTAYRNGSLTPQDIRYRGYLGESEETMLRDSAKRLRTAAQMAKQYGILLYLEPIACACIHTVRQGAQVIEMAGCDNVGLVLDIWHLWAGGDSPEEVAKLRANQILNVHFCDGLAFDRSTVPNEETSRDVWTGAGNIPLKEWVNAIHSTGYDGWFSCECFSKKAHEMDYVSMATASRSFMQHVLMT